ncbi:MAG: WbqC family protein [Gammaproteobacteria bacterium]|nr:WbqC family protein [Gammaproteobacteria bacterium]
MKLAIMQPYLFPYLGYFQLIRAVDTFVVYDDVNFIKGGWINRNFILAQGGKQLITLPLQGASPNLLINQVEVGGRPEKLLESIRHCYSKAPHFSTVFPMLENIFRQQEKNLARFLDHELRQICDYLGLHPKWHISSALNKDNELRGPEKVLAICEELGATHYINVPGGKELYDREDFEHKGLQLSFIQPRPIEYRQLGKTYVPNLSIIDVMMFNDQEQCAKLLEEYDLV